MKPSKYQIEVLKWLKLGEGNATCNAVAGSGKSTTLKLAAQELSKLGFRPEQIKIIVFGKQNSLDLLAKFGQQWKQSIQTLHSVGFQVLQEEIGRFTREEKVIRDKYRHIAMSSGLIPSGTQKGSLVNNKAISKIEAFIFLINLVRLTLSDLSLKSVSNLINHHNLEGINNIPLVIKEIEKILITGMELALNEHCIDYTDMIWLPVEWKLNQKSWFKRYEWLLVDECQDLNPAQLELSLMLASEKGRMLYVGDKNQAIFGFAGAASS